MLKLLVFLQSLKSNEEGQGMVEYGLIISLIAIAAIAGINLIAPALTTLFTDVAGNL